MASSTDTLTDTFSYTLKDGAGATSTAKLVVTLQGANDAPTVSVVVPVTANVDWKATAPLSV